MRFNKDWDARLEALARDPNGDEELGAMCLDYIRALVRKRIGHGEVTIENADDIISNTMLAIFKDLPRMRAKADMGCFGKWINKVAVFRIHQAYKEDIKRRSNETLESDMELHMPEDDFDGSVLENIQSASVPPRESSNWREMEDAARAEHDNEVSAKLDAFGRLLSSGDAGMFALYRTSIDVNEIKDPEVHYDTARNQIWNKIYRWRSIARKIAKRESLISQLDLIKDKLDEDDFKLMSLLRSGLTWEQMAKLGPSKKEISKRIKIWKSLLRKHNEQSRAA